MPLRAVYTVAQHTDGMESGVYMERDDDVWGGGN